MKKKKITLTSKQLEIMKEYWASLQAELAEFNSIVAQLENELSIATGIDNLEFFNCDGEYVGIGNLERNMPLIQSEELEK
jgi:hypothetical protein